MSCQEASVNLMEYLEGGLSPAERNRAVAHINECATCQRELAEISALQRTVRQSLRQRVAQESPSPEVWPRIEERLEDIDLSGRRRRQRGSADSQRAAGAWISTAATLVRRPVAIAAILLALMLGVVGFVPSVRAQVSEILSSWFHFRVPGTQSGGGIGGFDAFAPYTPSFLPDGFDMGLMGFNDAPGFSSLELEFSLMRPKSRRNELYATLFQSKGPAVSGLPDGEPALVDGQVAVFADMGALGDMHMQERFLEGAKLLVWFLGDVRIELVSNLPESEMLRIAESLVPMEPGQGE